MFSDTFIPRKAAIISSVTALMLGAFFYLDLGGSGVTPATPPLTLTASNAHQTPAVSPPKIAAAGKLSPTANYGRLPLYFIENRGQVDNRVKYYVKGSGQTTFFTPNEVVLALARPHPDTAAAKAGRPAHPALQRHQPTTTNRQRSVVRIKPVGLHQGVKLAALDRTEHRVNYFIGNDPKKWRTDLPTYQAVAYREAYKGIDITYYGQGRQLEYDIVVKPGADPGQVRFAYQGIKKLEVTPEGDLALHLPDGGRLLQKKPIVYQEIAGLRLPVAGTFRLCHQGARVTCGFAVAAYDKKLPLVIDPVLLYSTYLGGSSYDYGRAIAVDQDGCAYVTGSTWSVNFPLQNPYADDKGPDDAFVTKLNATGDALVYSTYLGGIYGDSGYGIAVDGQGRACLTGITSSFNFPTVNPQYSYGGGGDVFITKLSSAGNTLLYSTFLGGSLQDIGAAIAVNEDGDAFVTGFTSSENFPADRRFGPGGNKDAFVTRFNGAGQKIYAIVVGGTSNDSSYGIALDSLGNAYVAGDTFSNNFPTTSWAFQRTPGGEVDAFVAKVTPDGTALAYATYLGGDKWDRAHAVAVDGDGQAVVTGSTEGNFPVQGSLYSYYGGVAVFVAKLNSLGRALVYSTYLHTEDSNYGNGVALDRAGNAYVCGDTSSPFFPTKNSVHTFHGGVFDGFVAKLNSNGTALIYSTFLGGSSRDYASKVAVDPNGNAYVTGTTWSDNFPLQNPYAGDQGIEDAFVAKLTVPRVPLPPLLAFYPFTNGGQDASGNERHATVNGAQLTVAGFEGEAYAFNGVNTWITAPLDINPGRYPALTMGAWVNVVAISPPRQVLSHDNGGFDRSLGIDNRGDASGWSAFCGSAHVVGGYPAVPDRWTFLAVTYDQAAQKVTLYVDELEPLVKSGAVLGSGAVNLAIGRNPSFGEYFEGRIDNVFVFNGVLTPAQIKYIRDNGAAAIRTAIRRPGKPLPQVHLLLLED